MRIENKKRLLRRDGNICGLHLGGCGERITISEIPHATVDHIIPKAYYKAITAKEDDTAGRVKEFDQDWNCQPMHGKCNVGRGGQLVGYPRFQCGCHFLHITQGDLYIWAWDNDHGEWSSHMIVSEIAVETSPIQEAASRQGQRLVTREYIVIAAGWRGPGGMREMGFGKGESGHIIARMSPAEAKTFNTAELQRSFLKATTPEMAEMARGILTQLAKKTEG